MGSNEINIEPTQVASAGSRIRAEAGAARAATQAMFGSIQPAADGNPGFATAPELTAFATSLRAEIDDTITDLATKAQQVIDAARSIHNQDEAGAEGLSRIASSLNSLYRPLR
ncbi:hypothetical protein [Nocardia colli]|uniref:hypothetical protein n=1 Tax=Nocardia colli TaxID=2545717 RepID=UPI0035D74938